MDFLLLLQNNIGFLIILLGAGLLAGFAGGLFGIGGGVIMVPVLFILFGVYDVADTVRLPLAIGTSLSVIIVTSIRSLSTHRKSGEVDWGLLRNWLPWIALGASGAGFAAAVIPKSLLSLIFAVGAFYIGWTRLRGRSRTEKAKIKPITENPEASHWADKYAGILGVSTGFFSSLLGLGGGAAGVLIMGWTGRSMHRAVATASGFGIGVAIPGAIGFIISGISHSAELPFGAIGFVSLPAFFILALMTMITAPLGARLAHKLNAELLSKLFGAYILLISIMMVREALI